MCLRLELGRPAGRADWAEERSSRMMIGEYGKGNTSLHRSARCR